MILTKIHPHSDISLVHCNFQRKLFIVLQGLAAKCSMETKSLIRGAILNNASLCYVALWP